MNTPAQGAQFLENRIYSEIKVGDTASLVRTLRPEDIQLFAVMTGDINPAIVDAEFAHSGIFREVIAHGMWSASLISTVLGTQYPGPGTILVDQSIHFLRPVTIGDTITITVTVKQKFDHNHHVLFDCSCTNQEGVPVIQGTVEALAPLEKIKRQKVTLPEILISDKYGRYQQLLAKVHGLPPIDMAVAHPCDYESLKGPLLAAEHAVYPWVTWGVLPIFAFANAGVSFAGLGVSAFAETVTLGIALGLLIGKPVGVLLASRLAVRTGLAELPESLSWPLVAGAGILAGIGFTMSLFIGGLAFSGPEAAAQVRLGVLAGSVLAAVIGYLYLRRAAKA